MTNNGVNIYSTSNNKWTTTVPIPIASGGTNNASLSSASLGNILYYDGTMVNSYNYLGQLLFYSTALSV